MEKYNLDKAKEDLKVMTVLFRAQQAVLQVAKKDVKKYGLTINEFAVIEVLFHKSTITVQELCNKTLTPNSSMSYVLDKLEKLGIIARVQNEKDKRIFDLEFTKKGLEYANEIIPKHYENMKEIFDILDSSEKKEAIRILKKIGFNTR